MKQPTLLRIVLLAILLWGGEYLFRDFWEPDEARYAYVAEEMWEGGHWAVPHRHGEIYAHKPPLMFWLINAGSVFTGGEVNRVGARLPSLLGAIMSLWVIGRLALRWGDETTAWRAIGITATSFLFWQKGGMGQIDMLLCGLEMLALYHLFAFEWSPRPWRPVVAYLSMGFAILAKGPVGFLVPLAMYVASTLVARDGTPRWRPHYRAALPLALLPPAAWLLWAWTNGAPNHYFHELLFSQNISRAAGAYGHTKPFYYFLYHFPLEFMPWTPLLAAAFPAYRDASASTRVPMRRVSASALAVLLIFSLSASKRELYILAAYPLAGLLTAWAWPWITTHAARAVTGYFIAILGLAALVFSGSASADLVRNVLPFNGTTLLAPALSTILGTLYLLRVRRSTGPASSRMFAGFVLCTAVTLMLISTVVYAALNPLKGPYGVAETANRLLPPEAPILLYRINGEIMPLYADRPGLLFMQSDSLADFVVHNGPSLIVCEQKAVAKLPTCLTSTTIRSEFIMGNKHLVWLYVSPTHHHAHGQEFQQET